MTTEDLDQDVLSLMEVYESAGAIIAVKTAEGSYLFRYNGLFPADRTYFAALMMKDAV